MKIEKNMPSIAFINSASSKHRGKKPSIKEIHTRAITTGKAQWLLSL